MPEIIINNFHRGQASSPYVADGAYAKAVNLDVFGQPGIARINYGAVLESEDSGDHEVTDLINNFAVDPTTILRIFAAGERSGNIYYSANAGNSWTLLLANRGKRCVVWKDYLLACGHTTAINTYGPLTSSPNWNTGFENTTITAKVIFVSKNNGYVYVGHGRYVASIYEEAGKNFSDSDESTYTFTDKDLTLPEGYNITCIAEQREDLLIGANTKTSAVVFVWDRDRVEFTHPIILPESRINSIFSVGNRVYISAGVNGRLYVYSEAGLVPFIQIPSDYDDDKAVIIGEQGITWWKDRLLIGTKNVSDETTSVIPVGIYGVKGKAINLEHLISTGGDGSDAQLDIGAIHAVDDTTLLIGWYDKNNTDKEYGIDRVKDDFNRYTGYAAYLESIFYRVGTERNPANFSQIEVHLARPLQDGEGVRLKYREAINTAWSSAITTGTIDFATDGGIQDHIFDTAIKGIKNIQVRVELTTKASSQNTPYLLSVELR